MVKPVPHLQLAPILAGLIASRGLKLRDLVKATGFPQTTISSILSGKSKNPNIHLLKALADFFKLTIEQLVGYDPLTAPLYLKASRCSSEEVKERPFCVTPLTIPLLQWYEVKRWLFEQPKVQSYTAWLVNDACKSLKAFALKAKPSMRSYLCSEEATLLINPQEDLKDGLTVLVFLNDSQEPSLRLLTIDGDEKKLRSLEKDSPAIPLTPQHLVVGPVVEIRHTPTIK